MEYGTDNGHIVEKERQEQMRFCHRILQILLVCLISENLHPSIRSSTQTLIFISVNTIKKIVDLTVGIVCNDSAREETGKVGKAAIAATIYLAIGVFWPRNQKVSEVQCFSN